MSYWIVLVFLAISLVSYVLCAGADFGVGILELFATRSERKAIRNMGEHAIAPIWEANHVWIIVALVILFVGFPAIHVKLATDLHIPMLMMLAGIILRGTAFTFRYYDIQSDAVSDRLWTVLFRAGSLLVPVMFGLMVGAMASGQLQAEPSSFAQTYIHPWTSLFSISVGLFTTALFAWIAAVFLVGEAIPKAELHTQFLARARSWTLIVVVSGGVVSACAWWAQVPWLQRNIVTPTTIISIATSIIGVAFTWRKLGSSRIWSPRIAVGATVSAILAGYWGAIFPTALQLAPPASPLTWPDSAAPNSSLSGLAIALVVAGLFVVPSLVYLYRLFKRTHEE